MTTLSQYDIIQIRLIQKKIHLFENDKLDLFTFIVDLRALLNILESVATTWKDDFQAEINTLEMIHDAIEDGSITRWNGNYKEDMFESVSKLKKMTSLVDDRVSIVDEDV